MKGQWLGRDEHNGSFIILNIDELDDCYDGYAFVHPDNNDLPRSITFIQTTEKSQQGQVVLRFKVLDKVSGRAEDWEDVRGRYGNQISFQEYVTLRYKVNGFFLELSWEDEHGDTIMSTLSKTNFAQPSLLDHKTMQWDEFKTYIKKYMGKDFLFRGQNCPNPLRTSFHRAERTNFLRYMDHVKELHWHIAPKLAHVLDITAHEGLVSLLGIAQHHGYPTPLLDWSYSPYVAAYFAFCGSNYHQSHTARIYIFDNRLWHLNMSRIENIWDPRLFLTVVKPLAIGNVRMLPQQATTTLTNVDDIETYIRRNETLSGSKYLEAIDIHMSQRGYVMSDLRYMGITAGSLFPGIDGSCEELREKHFGR